jgi:bacterioferritin-associated ferredoxin
MYVCVCNAVPERAINDAMAEGASTLESLRARLGVGAGCGHCDEIVESMLRRSATAAEPVIFRPAIGATV